MPGAEPGARVVRQRSAVAAALYDLPIRLREVLALQYYAGLSEAETASALHITRGAVHAFAGMPWPEVSRSERSTSPPEGNRAGMVSEHPARLRRPARG